MSGLFSKLQLAFLLSVTLLPLQAEAIVVGGTEYTEILELETFGKQADGTTNSGLSYWWLMNKFASAGLHEDVVSNVNYASNELSEFDFSTFYIEGMVDHLNPIGYRHYQNEITWSDVTLKNDDGEVLLTLSYLDNGVHEWIDQSGDAGYMGIRGEFTVTGGILHDLGILDGSIYVAFDWDRIHGRGHRDVYSSMGTLRFYAEDSLPPEPVPEPASCILLATGILGMARVKKLKQKA